MGAGMLVSKKRDASDDSSSFLVMPVPLRQSDLDRIVRMACKIFRVESALVCSFDENRWYLASSHGLDPCAALFGDPFCAWAFRQDGLFVLSDTSVEDAVPAHVSAEAGLGFGFYAGRALVDGNGVRIGTFCLLSSEARGFFSEDDTDILTDLAGMAEVILQKRGLGDTQAALIGALATDEYEASVDSASGVWNRHGLEEMFARELGRATHQDAPLALALALVAIGDVGPAAAGGGNAIEQAAQLLRNTVRATDVVARYDENTFALILSGVYPALAPLIGDKIIRAFQVRENLNILGYDRLSDLNVGIAVTFPRRTVSVSWSSLLETAETALRAAQATGANRYEVAGISDSILSSLALA